LRLRWLLLLLQLQQQTQQRHVPAWTVLGPEAPLLLLLMAAATQWH
jgi:hypothetical protein